MIAATSRRARKQHRCTRCKGRIEPGEQYLELRMSPDHDGLGYKAWMRGKECAPCAKINGRVEKLEA